MKQKQKKRVKQRVSDGWMYVLTATCFSQPYNLTTLQVFITSIAHTHTQPHPNGTAKDLF